VNVADDFRSFEVSVPENDIKALFKNHLILLDQVFKTLFKLARKYPFFDTETALAPTESASSTQRTFFLLRASYSKLHYMRMK
jgi:hypothetical protein